MLWAEKCIGLNLAQQVFVKATDVVCGDCAGRVSANKLDLHVNTTEQILVLGLNGRTRGLVEGESEELSIVEYFSSAVSPGDVEILVEVTRRRC